MKYQIVFVVFGLICSVVLGNPEARVEEKIWENFEQADYTTIIVSFKKANTKAAYERFHSLKLTSRDSILNTHYAILKDHADTVQADVTSMLKKAAVGKKHRLDVLWISNQLIVRDVDKEVVEMLKSHPHIESLQADSFITLERVIEEEPSELSVSHRNISQCEWGVGRVRAPQVWANGNHGEGVVVGIIDTGCRHTHVQIAPSYCGNNANLNRPGHNYNWRDPSTSSASPFDNSGHGTHVTGTICGSEGIGVAPGATFMACRGCTAISCATSDLLSCGNFMACPTHTNGQNPNCSMAPKIVNNSWGGAPNNSFYNTILNAWRNVNILAVFAAGNSGPNCATAGSPGDQPLAFSVASIMENSQLSDFSSVGPGPGLSQKPEIAAPGSIIVSATNLADTGTRSMSGTSMAAPHISGVASLVLSANPNLTVNQLINALINGAVGHASQGKTCSGKSESDNPNFHTGYGIADVINALALAP